MQHQCPERSCSTSVQSCNPTQLVVGNRLNSDSIIYTGNGDTILFHNSLAPVIPKHSLSLCVFHNCVLPMHLEE